MSNFATWLLLSLSVVAVGLVTMRAIGFQHEAYYLTFTDYYSHGGHGPGVFLGKGAEYLGFPNEVTEATARAFFERVHPETGLPLAENQYRPNHPTSKNPRTAIDATFTLGDTKRALFALAPWDEFLRLVNEVLIPAHKTTVDYFEKHIAETRRGKGGRIRESADILAMAVLHLVDRNGTCFPHIHTLISHACVRKDRTTGALDHRVTFRAQRDLGRTFRADFDKRFLKLGYSLEQCPRNKWDTQVVGISNSLCDALGFGSRRREILEEVKKSGRSHTAAALAVAQRHTRKHKTNIPFAEYRATWAEVGREHDFSIENLKRTVVERSASRPQSTPKKKEHRSSRAHKKSLSWDTGPALPRTVIGDNLVSLATELQNASPGQYLSTTAKLIAPDHVRDLATQRGLSIVAGPKRHKVMKDAARAFKRSGYRVIAVAGSKERAARLRKQVPAATSHLSAGQLIWSQQFGIGQQIRYSLSTGIRHAIDPWAWSRWGKGHRIVHNRKWGIRPKSPRVDKKSVILVSNAHELSDQRIGDLLELASRTGAKLVFSTTAEPRRSVSQLIEEFGAVWTLEKEEWRGLGRSR